MKIKEQCNETYKKRHEKIEERIRELQPVVGVQNVEDAVIVSEEQEEVIALPETVETETPETFEEPDSDGITLYPGMPEQAQIGEDPDEEDNEAFDLEYDGIAA